MTQTFEIKYSNEVIYQRKSEGEGEGETEEEGRSERGKGERERAEKEREKCWISCAKSYHKLLRSVVKERDNSKQIPFVSNLCKQIFFT